MRPALLMAIFLSVLPWSGPSPAAITAYQFDDPVQERRFKELTGQLRCLVCQNQTIAESNAGLARDLKDVTYRMIHEGRTDEQIVNFMVERYGDFVLYRPPFKPVTALLWAGPPLLLAAGMAALLLLVRRRFGSEPGVHALSPAERQRLNRILKRTEERSR